MLTHVVISRSSTLPWRQWIVVVTGECWRLKLVLDCRTFRRTWYQNMFCLVFSLMDRRWHHNRVIITWRVLASQLDESICVCGLEFITLWGVSEHEAPGVSVHSQTSLIGSLGSSVTAEEPISRLLDLPPPPTHTHTAAHSCRCISLSLNAQPANPPALKMNV